MQENGGVPPRVLVNVNLQRVEECEPRSVLLNVYHLNTRRPAGVTPVNFFRSAAAVDFVSPLAVVTVNPLQLPNGPLRAVCRYWPDFTCNLLAMASIGEWCGSMMLDASLGILLCCP